MNTLPPTIAAAIRALVDQIDSPAVREALLTEAGWRAFVHSLQTMAGKTIVPEMLDVDTPASPSTVIPSIPPQRYIDQGRLGLGGMGEVRQVHDPALNRTVALKVIRAERMHQQGMLERFITEAQITAQLSHPAIVPVHELGRLPDGRHGFTMKQINGNTMDAVIRSIHAFPSMQTDWNMRRLLRAFMRVCEAMAYAHDRGVIHRDLKPENIMLGAFGEVLVMDWGLAKVIANPAVSSATGEPPIITQRSQNQGPITHIGRVTGTPGYMSPEQANGQHGTLTPSSDVFALGCILFEILTGRRAFLGENPKAILIAVRAAQRQPVPNELHTPPGLMAICDRAMAHRASERFADAQALHAALRDWMEGASRRSDALRTVEQADVLLPRAQRLRQQANALQQQAKALLHAIPSHAPEEHKLSIWEMEEEAHALEESAVLAEQHHVETLQTALKQVPDLTEAHTRLADVYQRKHRRAESRNEHRTAHLYEVLLASHDQGEHQAYLKGHGAVTLQTDPPGADVVLFAYTPHRRRLRAQYVRHLGTTPIQAQALPMGSYLLAIQAPGHATVRCPIHVKRQQHWNINHPIHLPPLGTISATEAYVPAGPFDAGGDPNAYQSLPRQSVWIDGFLMQRCPVTNHQYLQFLNDLVAQGKPHLAARHAPQEPSVVAGMPGPCIYKINAAGLYSLQRDKDGDLWLPDEPVVMIDWDSANAYAQWFSTQTGQPWRLPRGLEREKAARGVDGRLYPWGNFADPSWSSSAHAHAGAPALVPISHFPLDVSPYGIRHLAGNVRDWCLDPFVPAPPTPSGQRLPPLPDRIAPGQELEVRGGSWNNRQTWARSALRFGFQRSRRLSDLGFRLVRDLR